MSDSKQVVHRHFSLEQIEDLRDAAHSRNTRYDSSLRDEVFVTISADLGTRPRETVRLTRHMFDLNAEEVTIPAEIQKDYPIENKSPGAATLRLDHYGHFGTVRLLRTYLKTLDDEDYLFPSRQGGRINTNTARNITERLAVEGNVCPKRTDGKPSEPSESHPHAFRHSVANYMLADPDTRLVDVRNRLRHRSILTTERVYEHFQRR
ncbi:tyrosine-type recombinase/integrase [Natronolimnobius baerhuensis]|uniref:Tyr recombinase domain-containing protein n=1 Tax=Natronolimnobius baerhuensis TaxID=253108 RepID=A0A202EA99_9EURY|nr:hypothetical protein B2G88_12135 [Natronolimnobius baerhuensis]